MVGDKRDRPAARSCSSSSRDQQRANDGVLLPTELLSEVLLRLPADELCRLRLVCCSWRSLTSDPIFAKAHSSRHPLIVGLRSIAGRPDMEVQFLDPLSGGIVKRIPYVRPCVGHELSSHHCRVYVSHGFGQGKACVLDPATGSFTMLPTTSMVTENKNNNVIEYTSVFGRVPSTGEYKVLRIRHETRYQGRKPKQSCHIATLGADGSGGSRDARWRVKPCPPVHVSLASPKSTIVNGVAYFLPLDHAMSDDIAAFDFATEEWRHPLLRGPFSSHNITTKEEERVHFSLANLKGCLVSTCSYNRDNFYEVYSMDLWFLVDVDKEMWTKQYSLRSASIVRPYGNFIPLWILDDERVLVWVDGLEELKAYDPRTRTWTNLSMAEKLSQVDMYHGSLLCSDIAD